jgi:transposase
MGRYNALAAVAGVGLVTATELMSCMPELGRMNKREAAALAGVAPMNCDSGVLRGQRHIRGGRIYVRNALYMASVSGIRFNPVIRAHYEHLRNELKKLFKVAIVACMRKLLVHLNGICAKLPLQEHLCSTLRS